MAKIPYETIIGLEVHVQLRTKTKLFCGCPTRFGDAPNTNVCPVCLAHPGTLPVLNREAVTLAVRFGLAMGCSIRARSRFARKNYFYADLPKGYQISQYDEPLCHDGKLVIDVDGAAKSIGITRIHLEEDAGKLIHGSHGESLVDFNRAGVPLCECVGEPDLRSPAEAYEYLTELKAVVEYAGISNANMEEGSLRCDANVSLRPLGATTFGTRTEIKNLNSFRNVERALSFEVERQRAQLEAGDRVIQETRQWDAVKGETVVMRSKEEAHDYRYFPEPDLLPLVIEPATLEAIRAALPELPRARWDRLEREYALPRADARVLVLDRAAGDYFEQAAKGSVAPKDVANWVLRDVLRWAKETSRPLSQFPVAPASVAELVAIVHDGTISSSQAKTVFDEMVASGKSARDIVADKGLSQITDSAELEGVVAKVLAAFPVEVERYKSGKKGVLGFLVGKVMAETKGKGNPKLVNEIVTKVLG